MIILYLIAFAGGIIGVISIARGAIYVPTNHSVVTRIITLAKPQPGERMADLGAGDGRIVIAFAESGTAAYGIEHNPLLLVWARYMIRSKKLSNAHMEAKNFWDISFSSYDIIVIFGAPHIMKKLENKISVECRPGTRIISNLFAFPSLTPVRTEHGLRLYITGHIPKHRVGG